MYIKLHKHKVIKIVRYSKKKNVNDLIKTFTDNSIVHDNILYYYFLIFGLNLIYFLF